MDIFEVDYHHSLRPAVEEHIKSVYRRAFGAKVTLFAPRVFAAMDASGAVRCAAGVRTGWERFHSEIYLDRPAEQVASAALARPVHRRELLEFTTLACAQPGDALDFISDIVQMGRDFGCRVALFTGTAPLRKLLVRTGLTVIPIATAEGACVSDPQSWGRYYTVDPLVCVAPDSPLVPSVLRAPCFRSAGAGLMDRSAVPLPVPGHA